MRIDSHVEGMLTTAVRLVNLLTPGMSGGHALAAPTGDQQTAALAEALRTDVATVTEAAGAADIVAIVPTLRAVFEAAADRDSGLAAELTNRLLRQTEARPQLLPDAAGSWRLHFHGPDDEFGRGWTAGLAAGLSLALGLDELGRLGVCAADRCDRVYVDSSRNGGRQYCSTRCQNRTKAAAHRARQR